MDTAVLLVMDTAVLLAMGTAVLLAMNTAVLLAMDTGHEGAQGKNLRLKPPSSGGLIMLEQFQKREREHCVSEPARGGC